MKRAMYRGSESELSVGRRTFAYQGRLCNCTVQKSSPLSSLCWRDLSCIPPSVCRQPSMLSVT